VTKNKVRFDWLPAAGAMTYNLEVREDSKTGNKVVDKKNLTASEVKANLDVGFYLWRVTACNLDGCTKSKWWDFERK
jgi:hypothetical protein